jgi:hypothetical protein
MPGTAQALGRIESLVGGLSRAMLRARRLGGLRGGPARARLLTPKRRSEIARQGARARWGLPA